MAFRESGLEYVQTHGYNVMVWIVGGYDKKTSWDVYDKDCDLCEVCRIGTYSRYEKMISERSRDSVFILPTLTDKALLYPICSYGCDYYVIGNRVRIPIDPSFVYDRNVKETVAEKIGEWYARYKGRMLKFPFIKAKKMYIDRENRKYRAEHTKSLVEEHLPRAVFVSNKASEDAMKASGGSVMDKCSFVYANSRAYNDYLVEEAKGEDIAEDFILCANSGVGFYGVGVYKYYTVEPIYQPDENEKYLKQIVTMLDRLEEHYGMPVIIANHPRCDLRGYDFGGRKIINGKTCELTKKCRLFVTAITSAIAYPVIYNKEILFFYNDCIQNTSTSFGAGYVPLMKALELNGLNLDREEMINEPWNYTTKIRPEVRERYLEEYHYEKGAISGEFGEVLYNAIQSC